MALTEHVESYKFWDLVTLWARETLVHEDVAARALAKAIVRDGLMANSVDPRWVKPGQGALELRGSPLVGYAPVPGGEVMLLRAEALEHLLAVVRTAVTPDRHRLEDEFITKEDFKRWLIWSQQDFPAFWFGKSDRSRAV